MLDKFLRGRRLRASGELRSFCRETEPILKENLVMPYFVAETETKNLCKEIGAMPGQCQFSIDSLQIHLENQVEKGLKAVILFGIPAKKDCKASGAYSEDGIIQNAVRMIKKRYPFLIVITDVCLCEYMAHGHCGVLRKDGIIANDETLPLLTKTALSYAEAGADIIAPSDMMDGRIAAIRSVLNDHGFAYTPIMSYAVKYASACYGPFREAAQSAPASGDRKSYQMDPANRREALSEALADIEEGADIIIIKPGNLYADIIRDIRNEVMTPLAAYQVSGEYSMIKAAAQNGWINEDAMIQESLLCLKRAGATILITYFTEHILAKGMAL